MESNFNSFDFVGMACCGLYYSKEKFRCFISEADLYINSSGELEFPFVDLIVKMKLLHNSKCYSIQIAPTSANHEYGMISGHDYSTFKVTEYDNNNIGMIWNGDMYSIVQERNLNTFNFTINQHNVVRITKAEDGFMPSCYITFPSNTSPQLSELNSLFDQCLSQLNHILSGYSLPEPFFTDNLYTELEKMFTVLRDPLLPSWQFQRYLDSVSSLLPASLVNDLQQIVGQYTSNFSSLFSRFPSNKIRLLVDSYVTRLNNNSTKLDMAAILRPTLELAEMYSGGTRGNAKDVIERLLLDYLKVEVKFQDEETLLNYHLINKQITVADVISHNNVSEKNKFILTLFEFLERFIPGLIPDLRSTIQKLLTNLTGSSFNLVISKLREVLVTGQIPSYEIRKNEMEAIFLNSINGYGGGNQICKLESLICSNSEVFDVISDFFYHKITAVRKCAMEVYVRRAYMTYEICSFEQSQLDDGQLCVVFKFALPSGGGMNSTGHGLKRCNSSVALITNKTSIPKKYSPTYRASRSSGFIEKDDTSDEESSNEDFCQLGQNGLKSNDYDTDSAISVGAGSLSELSVPMDSDCFIGQVLKGRHSPSVHSLDRFSLPFNYPNLSDGASTTTKTSDLSLDKSMPRKFKRSVSVFCNNQSLVQPQDLSTHCDLGVMIIFDTVDEIERNLPAIRQLLSVRNSAMDDLDFLEYNMATLDRDSSPVFKVVLKLTIRDEKLINRCDSDVANILDDFCRRNLSFLNEICVIRITFLMQSMDKTFRYFTFRKRGQFEEDMKIRNIDPTLSFQLEINRLRNYHLDRLSVPNRRMYVYMGTSRDGMMPDSTEYRMFTRCIIYHKDFQTPMSTIDFVAKEAERNLLEAMDAFDMAWIDERASSTKSNHIFFYFHSILCLNRIDELENVVRAIIFKHGRRLWSLRITQAELKMTVKLSGGPTAPIRLWVHNEGGKSLEVSIYREEVQFKTDRKVLISWSTNKDCRYHGVPVDCFYST